MKKHFLTLAVAIPALALAGCGGNGGNSSSTTTNDTMADTNVVMPADEGNGTDMGNATAAMPAMSTQEFANKAATSDMFEIESAKVAQGKVTSSDLKDFAKDMINDHTASTKDLKSRLAKLSPAVTPKPELTAEQKDNLAKLKSTPKGADFDALYKSQQLEAHQMALSVMQGYAANGADADIKDFASDTAKVVQHHLDKLQGSQ